MTTTPQIPKHVVDAVRAVAGEVPDAALDDQLDAIYTIVGADAFHTHETAIIATLSPTRSRPADVHESPDYCSHEPYGPCEQCDDPLAVADASIASWVIAHGWDDIAEATFARHCEHLEPYDTPDEYRQRITREITSYTRLVTP